LYKKTATLNGNLTVSKTGVTGSGRIQHERFRSCNLVNLSFSSKDFGARHARFEVKTGNPDKPALAGNDVRLKFHLDQNFATISPEVEEKQQLNFRMRNLRLQFSSEMGFDNAKIVMTKARRCAARKFLFLHHPQRSRFITL